MAETYPRIAQVVLDTTDARALAEFYHHMFGLEYGAGDEPPEAGQPDPRGGDWLVLHGSGGGPQLAYQQTDGVRPSTWPDATVPQMFHLDTAVDSRGRALPAAGARAAARRRRATRPHRRRR